jgi:hypothetical protein
LGHVPCQRLGTNGKVNARPLHGEKGAPSTQGGPNLSTKCTRHHLTMPSQEAQV